MLAAYPVTPSSSKSGAIPTTKTTATCAAGLVDHSTPNRFDLAKTDKAVRSAVRKARKDYIFRRD